MANLKKETLGKLNDYGKTPDDIVWIGCKHFKIGKDEFWKLADVEYDNGYGGQEVALDLLIVGTDWWMERQEYDGAEWWKFKTAPTEPDETRSIVRLTVRGSDEIAWSTLEEVNKPSRPEEEDEYDYCSLY